MYPHCVHQTKAPAATMTILVHLHQLDRQDWIAICCVSLIVATLVWLGMYCSGMKVDVRSLQLRMREVEASQRHLKSIVERGWAQSLDLTKIDWRRPDPAQE